MSRDTRAVGRVLNGFMRACIEMDHGNGYRMEQTGFPQCKVTDKLLFVTIPDLRAVNAIEAAATAAKRNNCKCWCITVVAHSQGTMIVKRALDLIDPKTKKHISLIGLGGETSFGPGDGVAATKNIWEKDDPVPNFWNRLSFWNGNDDYHMFDYPDLSGIPAHSWDESYLKYLKKNPSILKGSANCVPK